MVAPALYRPVDAPGGDPDTHLRILTFHFGHRNGQGAADPILSAKWIEGDRMFRSEFDNIYYPTRRQATDGEGRTVADTQRTRQPEWIL